MRLKKNLKSMKKTQLKRCSAQAISEYVMIFAVLLVGVVVAFQGFNPGYETDLSAAEKVGRPVMRLTRVFQDAANGTINHIASWR